MRSFWDNSQQPRCEYTPSPFLVTFSEKTTVSVRVAWGPVRSDANPLSGVPDCDFLQYNISYQIVSSFWFENSTSPEAWGDNSAMNRGKP